MFISCCAVAGTAHAAKKDRMCIAILSFDAITEDAKRDNKGRVVSERLTTAAVKSGLFDVVERHMVEQLFSEMEFGESELSGPAAQKIGHLLGAEYVLIGTVAEFGGEMSIDARLVRVADGSITLAENSFSSPTLSGITQATALIMQKIVAVLAPDKAPAPPPAQSAAVPPPKVTQQPVVDDNAAMREFLNRLFALQLTNDMDTLGKLYGDPVLYYDQGKVSRKRIIREKKAYVKRWPRREGQVYDLTITPTGTPGISKANYILRWRVTNDQRDLSGTAAVELLLQRQGNAISIVGEKSSVVARD